MQRALLVPILLGCATAWVACDLPSKLGGDVETEGSEEDSDSEPSSESGPGDPLLDVGGAGDDGSKLDVFTDDAVSEACAAYCNVEGECLADQQCECEEQVGTCSCGSEERIAYCDDFCHNYVESWAPQGEACRQPTIVWLQCIGDALCSDVQTFFDQYPDGLIPSTACFDEFEAIDCLDWATPVYDN